MKLGLGTVQLGIPYGVSNRLGKPTIHDSLAILQIAWENGINFFDTAPTYGDSESIIGEFIKQNRLQEKISISTKSTPGTKNFETAVRQSLQNLNIHSIDYYLIHSAQDVLLYGDEIFSQLERLKEKGFVKKIGVSVYNEQEITKCLAYNIDVLQIPFNIFDRRLLRSFIFPELKEKNIEIHARSIYLQGLLLMEPEQTPPHLQGAKPYLQKLADICEAYHITKEAAVFSYVLENVFIDKMIIGAESTAQVLCNAAYYQNPPLPEDIFIDFEQHFANIEEQILNPSLWGV